MHQLLALASQGILAAGEEGASVGGHHAIVPGITDGPLVELAWLIVVVPIVAAFMIALFGTRLPFKGWELAWGSIAFVGLYGTILMFFNATKGSG